MKEFRCSNCNRMLAKLNNGDTIMSCEVVHHVTDNMKFINDDSTEIEIKCPKCKELNQLVV